MGHAEMAGVVNLKRSEPGERGPDGGAIARGKADDSDERRLGRAPKQAATVRGKGCCLDDIRYKMSFVLN